MTKQDFSIEQPTLRNKDLFPRELIACCIHSFTFVDEIPVYLEQYDRVLNTPARIYECRTCGYVTIEKCRQYDSEPILVI